GCPCETMEWAVRGLGCSFCEDGLGVLRCGVSLTLSGAVAVLSRSTGAIARCSFGVSVLSGMVGIVACETSGGVLVSCPVAALVSSDIASGWGVGDAGSTTLGATSPGDALSVR